ncbi:MAG: alginate export family protein [Candidatus Omnitrophota bacterium]|nr:MAG: alginate export family protein [Candidatus Omnitrophota bacterium]
MGRKLLIAIAVMSFAFIGYSYAGVESIKVSGDITAQALTRDLTLGLTDATNADDENYLISQVRLRFDADLTEDVSAVIMLLNERLWGDTDWPVVGTDNDDEIRLEEAYVELKEMLYQPLTVRVGRQPLRYGNALIIGDPDTNQGDTLTWGQGPWTPSGDLSMHKSFDLIRAVLDYSPYTVDLLYGRLDENATTEADDVTIFGAYGTYEWSSYNGISEGYFIGIENSPGYNLMSGGATPAENQSEIFVLGGRIQFDPNDNLTIGLETAMQFGDVLVDMNGDGALTDQNRGGVDEYQHLNASAYQLISEYRFLNDYNGRINLSYTYLSGDDDVSDSDNHEAWAPMGEDQTPAEIMNILGANTNAHFIRLEGSYMPREDITLGLIYAKAVLAQSYGANANTNAYSPPIGPAAGYTYVVDRDETGFGDEINAYVVYDYTEDVQMKLLGAWFIPGDFFDEANDSVAYSIRGALALNF